MVWVCVLLLANLGLASCSSSTDTSEPTAPVASTTSNATPVLTYHVIETYPHDRHAFTQGLVFDDGVLFEGTGLHGQSTVRRVDLATGKILQRWALPARFFGEGLTVYGNNIIQLTWQSQVGFVYDKTSLALLQEFTYPTEGWGLTHDGSRLIMSDGTSTLYFLHPETFREIGRVVVHDDLGPVARLNELEYVRGQIYANVWQTHRIAMIHLLTGRVTGWINLAELLRPQDRRYPVDVLNGIAYDAEGDRLFVTGKLWPKLFEIKLIEPE
jgi:glutamine cyclotransferase